LSKNNDNEQSLKQQLIPVTPSWAYGLEPVASEIRTVAAQKFAQIMQIDPTLHGYSYPLGLAAVPNWSIGELRFQKLRSAGFLAFGQS